MKHHIQNLRGQTVDQLEQKEMSHWEKTFKKVLSCDWTKIHQCWVLDFGTPESYLYYQKLYVGGVRFCTFLSNNSDAHCFQTSFLRWIRKLLSFLLKVKIGQVLSNFVRVLPLISENFEVAQIWLCDPPFDAKFHAEFKNV